MSISNMILLLRIAKGDGAIGSLLTVGLEVPQIAMLLEEAKRQKYLVAKDYRLVVTDVGERLLAQAQDEVEGAEWVRPLESYRIPKTDQKEVYLPLYAPGDQ